MAPKPYGKVAYADAKNGKYPIDTEEHIRAAWNYIHQKRNAAKYSAEEVKAIKSKIVAAWKKKIDKSGPPSEMADVAAKDLVIFRAGTWNGETFTTDDLDNMAASVDPNEPIPFIIGHSSDYKGHTRIPAFGRITRGLKRVGSDLVAMGVMFNEKLAAWIKEGFYNQRSIELTRDNKRVLAVGMLGATPPAVKGMPSMDEALDEVLAYSEDNQSKVIEFAEDTMEPNSTALDEAEAAAVDDTFKNVAECCAEFLNSLETMLSEGEDPDRIMQEVWEHQTDIINELNLHASFIKKIEQIEEASEDEMSEKRPGWKQFADTIRNLFNNRKESNDMDQKERTEFAAKIAELESKLAEKEAADKAAAEAKAKEFAEAEAKRVEAEAKAKEEAITLEVKEFCDAKVKENLMTPAMVESDTPIMLELARTSAEALKSFRQKYSSPVVPLGVVKEVDQQGTQDTRSQIVRDAEAYAQAHKADKEFAGLTPQQAISRALYLHSTDKIKFGSGN
jgi:hypothetical protein